MVVSMGLLNTFLGTPDQTQALGLLGIGMMNGGFGKGAGMAMQHMAGAKEREQKGLLAQLQLENVRSEMEARKLKAAQEQAEMQRQQGWQSELPSLYRQPGMTGGEAVPQTMNGIPMFSQPVNAAPMRQTPGGFDVQRALQMRMTPKEIAEYAGLDNLNRPEVARTVEVDDGRGGKATIQLDKFGQPIGQNMPGYIPPVQVNQGDRVTFQRPTAGVSLPVNMSPDARASNSLGWANHGLSKQRLAFDANNAQAGRAPAGYRFNGSALEAIPGGPADKQAAATADERKAATLLQRLEGSQRQLQAAVTTNPGAAKPDLLASGIRALSPKGEAIANSITGTQRQQVDAAQLDILDAALTLATGAAYTREQLEGHRKSYFPQIGDDPPTVKDKQDRLNNVIKAARIAAGRAGGATSGGASGGWSIQKVN